MKKMISAAAAAMLSVCLFAGCSGVQDDGTMKEASKYETVECGDYNIKLRKGFHKFKGEDYIYYYKMNKKISMTYMYGNAKTHTTPETLLDYQDLIVGHDDKNKEKDIIQGKNHVIAYYASDFDDEESGDTYRIATYEISESNNSFYVSVSYPPKNEELGKALGLELIDSVEFVGDYAPPADTVTYDLDYFTFDADPKFTKAKTKDDKENVLQLRYTTADSLSKFFSYYEISYEADSIYDSAEEFSKARYERYKNNHPKNSDFFEEPHEVEAGGYTCWRSGYENTAVDYMGTFRRIDYVFEHDGVIYDIYQNISLFDDYDEILKDAEKLIENIEVRDLSEDEQQKLSDAKFVEYETDNFRYTLTQHYKLSEDGKEYTASKAGVTGKLRFREFDAEKESVEDHAEYIAKYDYDIEDFKLKEKEIGGKEYKYFCGTWHSHYYDKDMHDYYFYYTEDGKAMEVKAEVSFENEDEIFDDKFIMAALESVELK